MANAYNHVGFVRKHDYDPNYKIPLNQWFEKPTDSEQEQDPDGDVHNFVEEQVKTKLSDFNFILQEKCAARSKLQTHQPHPQV